MLPFAPSSRLRAFNGLRASGVKANIPVVSALIHSVVIKWKVNNILTAKIEQHQESTSMRRWDCLWAKQMQPSWCPGQQLSHMEMKNFWLTFRYCKQLACLNWGIHLIQSFWCFCQFLARLMHDRILKAL